MIIAGHLMSTALSSTVHCSCLHAALGMGYVSSWAGLIRYCRAMAAVSKHRTRQRTERDWRDMATCTISLRGTPDGIGMCQEPS
ncbi:hypothetical protein C8Q76DRAFT_750442 [Earliella scabrosa]|nr:hypothetical protein C8Q76DRAFT_750442 [Earliella scabrosa]